MNKIIKIIFSIIILNIGCLSASFAADILRLASLFQEHMVLQQKMDINIWGEATPNAIVLVNFASFKTETKADKEGNWKAKLPSQNAGGPFILSISSGMENIKFNDVMVGEVWICAGQSNMVLPYQNVPNIKALESSAKNIRTFQVTNNVSFKEEKYTAGEWKIGNPPSAVAFTFAYFLEQAGNVPIGIIQTAWGSSSLEGWMPKDLTAQLPYFAKIMNDFDANKETESRISAIISSTEKRPTKDDIFLRTQPNILYNAMMKPLAPYVCRGMVWYQGEANAKSVEDMQQYGISLPIWVKRIRQEFANQNMYFLGVMLPGYKGTIDLKAQGDEELENPNNPSWAWIRESQLKVVALPNADIATTIDLGDKNNIHPLDKLAVGQRLALLAEKHTLGMGILVQGPVFKSAKIKGNSIIITYQNAKGLKTTDGEAPKAFWLADETGKWVKADAKIKNEQVILTAKEITPLYVRYAFSSKPSVNLVNEASVPARPFRTDNFKP